MQPVLFIDDEREWRGGQDSLFLLLRGLAERQAPFLLAAAEDGALARRARDEGWALRPFRPGGECSIRSLLFFRRLIREFRPSILFYNTPHPIVSGLWGARLTRLRPVHLYARRVIFPLRKNPFSRWKHRRAVDYFIAISAAVRSVLTAGGVPADRIFLVPEGLRVEDFDAIPPARAEFPPEAGCQFFCAAALTGEKGVDVLIRAFADHRGRFPDSSLTITGTGRLQGALTALARETGSGKGIRFLGFRPDFEAVLKCMDAVVVPSLAEGFGRVALYAMAAALPVVGSRVGGIPEVVSPEETGLLTPPGDAAALAAALDRLAGDRGAARRMGECGRNRLLAGFTHRHVVDCTLAVFDAVLFAFDNNKCGSTIKSDGH